MVTNGNNIYVTFVIKGFVMKERLIQLLDLEQLTPSKFADIIGVQRSSISHVISGRNKPSFDFLQKTLRAFPGLNASWLLLGEGTMYEQMGRKVSGNLFDTPEASEVLSAEQIPDPDLIQAEIQASDMSLAATGQTELEGEHLPPPAEEENEQKEKELKETDLAPNRIVQVMVIYADDTFKTYKPAQ